MKLGPLYEDELTERVKEKKLSSLLCMGDDEYDRLNPPVVRAIITDDGIYLRQIDDDRWLPVGCILTPRTRLGWFVYHMVHGLAMRYRLLPVLLYSIKHAFSDSEAHDAN